MFAEAMSTVSSEFITAIFAGVASILSIVGTKMWCSKKAKRPLDSDDLYVRQSECRQYRCAIEKRIADTGEALNRIFRKLNEMDTKSEERANDLHRRIDPIVESVAAQRATLEMMKERK